MTIYEKELEKFRSHDKVQSTEKVKGYDFIATAGHGYLVVPEGDEHYLKAKEIVSYGYEGRLAIYLEEDCEMPEFLKAIN